jgi:1,4-alpha-glucan branching enzyme
VHHVNDWDKVIAWHRWLEGGEGDDVVVLANFKNLAWGDYRIGFPHGGTWKIRFNSDWQGYDEEFGGAASDDIVVDAIEQDGMPYSASLEFGAYSMIILSQSPTCPTDQNGDGAVNVDDILSVIAAWGTPDADVTGDGQTNVDDLLATIGSFGDCP